MEKELYIISFKSTHYAIMAENKLKHYNIVIMPTPREITANCGLSIGFLQHDYKSIIQEIKLWDEYETILEIYLLNKETRLTEKILVC